MPGLTGHLKDQIEKQWGTVDTFKSVFAATGLALFAPVGSGFPPLPTAPSTSPRSPAPPILSPAASPRSSPSTSGNTPTTLTTRTAAPCTWMPCGGLWIGAWWRGGMKDADGPGGKTV